MLELRNLKRVNKVPKSLLLPNLVQKYKPQTMIPSSNYTIKNVRAFAVRMLWGGIRVFQGL